MSIPKLIALTIAVLLAPVLRAQTVIRVGAFPNITHPQAMVGKATGWFEKAMGSETKIEWKSFNAGPSAIEALFAGAIDMTYVGPNPTINGYVRSNGEAVRVIAGATSGGAALGCATTRGFRSRRISTERRWPRPRWVIRRTSRCVPGSKPTA